MLARAPKGARSVVVGVYRAKLRLIFISQLLEVSKNRINDHQARMTKVNIFIVWSSSVANSSVETMADWQIWLIEIINLVPKAHVSFGQRQDAVSWHGADQALTTERKNGWLVHRMWRKMTMLKSMRMRAVIYNGVQRLSRCGCVPQRHSIRTGKARKVEFGFERPAVSIFESKRHGLSQERDCWLFQSSVPWRWLGLWERDWETICTKGNHRRSNSKSVYFYASKAEQDGGTPVIG